MQLVLVEPLKVGVQIVQSCILASNSQTSEENGSCDAACLSIGGSYQALQ